MAKFNKLLKNQPEACDSILAWLNMQLRKPEEMIIRQGDTDKEVYLIARGECEVRVWDESWKDQFVKRLKPGRMFGEVANITQNRWSATVKSRYYSTIAYL